MTGWDSQRTYLLWMNAKGYIKALFYSTFISLNAMPQLIMMLLLILCTHLQDEYVHYINSLV